MMPPMLVDHQPSCVILNYFGHVQGVGMRPFLYRVATDLNLKGTIYNHSCGVTAELTGPKATLEIFHQRVLENATQPIRITEFDVSWPISWQKKSGPAGLSIISNPSVASSVRHSIQPDAATCEKCWSDFFDRDSRFFNYPFVTCSECGPRWTILHRFPFERNNTSYSQFPMCTQCQNEYENPNSRRHHAQTISCSACGPQIFILTAELSKISSGTDASKPSLQDMQRIISNGGIGLIKGVGGFQLIGHAKNPKTIERIRRLKSRPTQSLAIMVDGRTTFLKCGGTENDWRRLSSPEAPIVSIRNFSHPTAKLLAPDLSELGVMAPTTPLHKLLFGRDVETLVVTSGNPKGFPLPKSREEIRFSLGSEIDFIIDHNRPIVHAIDDSVVRRELVLRKARGFTPAKSKTKTAQKTQRLALGADLKNAVALHLTDEIIEFPYCGDLLSGPGLDAQCKNVSDYLDLFQVAAHDLKNSGVDFHPETLTQNLSPIQTTAVPHHLAHAWAAYQECPSDLVLTFDGTGYDDHFELGGGEGFTLSDKIWHRCLQLKPIKFVGGSSSVIEPWKSLVLFFASTGMSLKTLHSCFTSLSGPKISSETLDVFYTFVMTSNGALTTSMGRWFDAAAALIEFGSREQSYEAQAPIRLEHLAKPYQYDFDATQWITHRRHQQKPLIEVNSPALLLELLTLKQSQTISTEHLAFIAHDMMAQTMAQACHSLNVKSVAGTGGVFQNELFSQLLRKHLLSFQIQFNRPKMIPVNDQAIALGQLFYLENANA